MRALLIASAMMLAAGAALPVYAQSTAAPAGGASGTSPAPAQPQAAAAPTTGAQTTGTQTTGTQWPAIATNVDGIPGANWGQDGTPVYVQPDGAAVTYSNVPRH